MFWILCIYILLYYIRPFEWYDSWQRFPFFQAIGVISVISLLVLGVTRRIKLFRYKNDVMMAGLAMAVVLSHVSHAWFGGALNSLMEFFPMVIGYFLVAHSLKNKKQIELFLYLIIMLSSFLAIAGIIQYTKGIGIGGVEPLYEINFNEFGKSQIDTRIRWYGPFNDPNDLGLALVIPIAFLVEYLFNRRYLIPLMNLALLITAIYFTNSRGTLLALISSIITYFIIRYKSIKGAILAGTVAFIFIVLGPSRMASITSADVSAYGRLESWHAGFQMLKEYPLFGVGMGMYTDYHGIVAHNSFIHVLAELGLFGSLFYFALFYYPLRRTRLLFAKNNDFEVPDYYVPAISSLVGIMIAIFFLSRIYMLLPFMLVGLITAITNSKNNDYKSNEKDELVDKYYIKELIIVLLLVIFLINILLKILLKLSQ